MKHLYIVPFILLLLLGFHSTRAQNVLTLHMRDTTFVLESVDSIYYGQDSNQVQLQYVSSRDSLYTFVVDEIDSMTYLGPYVTANGVVRGVSPDSLMVVSMTEVVDLTDSLFSLQIYRSKGQQLLAVLNADSLPVMLYRGVINEGDTIVIDTFSTAMALLLSLPELSRMADSGYAYFDSLVRQADSFPNLMRWVSQSITAGRELADSVNLPLFLALSDVYSQLTDSLVDTMLSNIPKSNYYMGNHTMLVQTAGSMVNMRMWDLNPTYIGTVTDAQGTVLRQGLRVPARADYGVMDIFFNLTAFGEYTTFNMQQGAGGPKYFDFTCRSLPAQLDYYISAWILPVFSYLSIPSNSCTRSMINDIAISVIQGGLDGVLRAGSYNANETNYIATALDAVSTVTQSFFTNLDLDEAGACFVSIPAYVFGQFLKLWTICYSTGKMAINTAGRTHYYFHEAPDDISFCMEYYGTGSAHQCTQPGLICHSGNGQQGTPGNLLPEPIVLRMNALDENGDRQERNLTLNLNVTSGGGTITPSTINLTTSPYYDSDRQVQWQLGTDTSQPQRAVAWLTDPTTGQSVGTPLTLSAFFLQDEPHIDSFKVAANRYVAFSRGNLQYQPSTATWRFAEQQYDVIGTGNLNITDNDNTYTGWIDLFSWSTAYNPTFVPTNNTYYDTSANGGTFYEWGVHPISNGGAQMNMWRTPTMGEWNYLLTRRPDANNLMSYATVCGVHGLIILPDNWQQPDSVLIIHNDSVIVQFDSTTMQFDSVIVHHDSVLAIPTFTPAAYGGWTANVYDTAAWNVMESAGAIFLPAAGFRCFPTASSTTLAIHQLGNAGAYWSNMGHVYYPTYGYTPSQHAYRMNFFGTNANGPVPYLSVECWWGQSVRLIRNL